MNLFQRIRPVTLVFIGFVVVAVVVGLGNTYAAKDSDTTPAGDTVTVRLIGPQGEITHPVSVPAVNLTEAEWREKLSDQEFYILRENGTERAYTGDLLDNKDEGLYVCGACKLPLFDSKTKFDSGTGWPSFYMPVARENIVDKEDRSFGMVRTENVCARCGSHLGHVFPDGPDPTGLRYCMNAAALDFVAKEDVMTLAKNTPEKSDTDSKAKVGDRLPAPEKGMSKADAPGEATAVLAGGCFWCTEAVFEELDGVKDVVSGYCGGDPKRADYRSVTTGTTGHAEAIKITYDPSEVSYGELLRIFFATHDPTTKNRQGPDSGPQYRSAVFYEDEEQKAIAESYIQQLDEAKAFSKPIVTTLEPLDAFHVAEEYHQDFVDKNPQHPYVQMWAVPKIQKVKKITQQD